MSKNNDLLLYGGIAVAAGGLYFLTKNQSASTAVPVTTSTTVPGAPTPPTVYSDSYYKTYQYPAIVKAYPNVANPNYLLTQTDANNYAINYPDLRQWSNLATTLNKYGSSLAALQYHWKTYGVPEQRSFILFSPTPTNNFVPAPASSSSSGSSSTLSSVLGVATSVLTLLGPTDQLNDMDVELLIEQAYIAKNILPFFASADPVRVEAIENRIDSLLTQYA